jgi:BMFP domain-containing protein YqiC
MNSQGPNRFLDEFAKLMTDAAGLAQGVQKEAETAFRAQGERFLAKMDLVQREDFDVVRDMASHARSENEELKETLSSLEARIANLEKAAKPAKPRANTKK